MTKIILCFTVLSLAVIAGCGKSSKSDEDLTMEARLEKLTREMTQSMDMNVKRVENVRQSLTERLENVENSIAKINSSIEELSGGAITLTTGTSGVQDQYAVLNNEIEKLKNQIQTLEGELNRVRDLASGESGTVRITGAEAYTTMSDPQKLAEKLDELVRDFGPKLEESGKRAQFEADIEIYKATATREYTTDELLIRYKESVQKQLDEATDDRMKEWYQRQLQILDESSGDALESRLRNYRRYENMRELSNIIQKYPISRNDLRRYNLQVFGGGWSGERGNGDY